MKLHSHRSFLFFCACRRSSPAGVTISGDEGMGLLLVSLKSMELHFHESNGSSSVGGWSEL